jgi:hypothetical protein
MCIHYRQNSTDCVTSCDMQYISCSLTDIQALKAAVVICTIQSYGK